MKHLRDMSCLHYVLLLHGQAQLLRERYASTEKCSLATISPKRVPDGMIFEQVRALYRESATPFSNVADIMSCSHIETQQQL